MGRTVRWSRDLEQYSEFEREVQRLHSLDKQVINNRSILEHLQAQLATSFADHCRIARQLDILEAHQIEMDNVLKTPSIDLKTAQSVFVSTSNERELLFTFGEDVSSKVQAVTQMFLQSESYPKQSVNLVAVTSFSTIDKKVGRNEGHHSWSHVPHATTTPTRVTKLRT